VGNPVYDSIFVEENTFLKNYPLDSEEEEFTMLIPVNINEAIDNAKEGINFRGEIPDDFFILPIMKSSLYRGAYSREDLNEEMVTVDGNKINPELLSLIDENDPGEPLSNGKAFLIDGYTVDRDNLYAPDRILKNEIYDALIFKGVNVQSIEDKRIIWESKTEAGAIEAVGDSVIYYFPDKVLLPMEYKFSYTTDAYASSRIKIEVNGRELPNSPISPEEYYDEVRAMTLDLGNLVFDKFEEGIEIKITMVAMHYMENNSWHTAPKKQYTYLTDFTIEPVLD
jgi:hypothetical protein